jgi:hypothetical protein
MFGPWGRTAVRRRVVVNLLDGTAISGVLWARRGPLLVIRGALLLEPGGEPAAMDGEAVIERSQVSFIQVLAGG